jgi:hypothetical protein
VIFQKQKTRRVNGGSSKNNGHCERASDGQSKALLRAYCKPALALASHCKRGLASAYKGPFLGWWGRVRL